MLTENGILKSEIRAELNRVLDGRVFSKSPLLSRFLRFIVERTLDGHANQVKEYTVGMSVLGKPHSFNPQTDASVRIHAIRLRKSLDEHYRESGNLSGIRIVLPKGTYCPDFLGGNEAAEILKAGKHPVMDHFPENSICVVPFNSLVNNGFTDFSVDGFSAYLSEKLSLFQDIQVKSYRSVSTYFSEGGKLEKLGTNLDATYYLAGSIEIGDQHIQVSVQLFDAGSNTLIWSQEFSGDGRNDLLEDVIDRIASGIVASLAGYSGLLHHRLVTPGSGKPRVLSNSQANAIFWFYHFQTRLSESIFQEALSHLEKATQENPDCDLCWAVLAHLYAHSIIYNYDSGVENPLARAQAYVARAFTLNPSSQQGHITMAWIQIFLRNKSEAKWALEQADEINPNSSYAKAVCSLGMSFLGEYEAADALMTKAIPLNPLPYWWFNLPPIFKALKANDYNKVLFHARKIGTPAGIHEHVFEMIALHYLGQTDSLKAIRKAYLQKYPDGIVHALRAWPKILFDEALLEKIILALTEIVAIHEGVDVAK